MKVFKEFTPEVITGLKQDFGENLHQIDVETEDGAVSFIAKKPSRATVSAVTKYGAEKKMDKANDVLVGSCLVAGTDETALDNADVFLAVLEKLGELMKAKEVQLKKL